jgi:hypothetical protein
MVARFTNTGFGLATAIAKGEFRGKSGRDELLYSISEFRGVLIDRGRLSMDRVRIQ